VLRVHEFDDIPILCTRDYSTGYRDGKHRPVLTAVCLGVEPDAILGA
jgi:hypothetical protein